MKANTLPRWRRGFNLLDVRYTSWHGHNLDLELPKLLQAN